LTGEGTYYDADGSGNCSFPPSPGDLLVAAMNELDYDGSAVCGACVAIDGPDGSVTVRIVDRCPECAAGDIDMSPQAFERIAPIAAGRVPISWRYVACEPAGALVYHFKEGSNQWWTAVQIRNHRHPIATFEFQAEDGSFRAVPRESYNYFVEASGMGPGPYTFRVTDVLGNMVEDTGVPFVENGDSTGAQQFPACSGAQGATP
jgi:expansin (peptidoglycan-binding protein)